MREFVIEQKDDGKRLDKWIQRELPTLKMGLRQKYLRLKRFKVNGKAAQGEFRLTAGDMLRIYLNDDCFEKPKKEDAFLKNFRVHLRVVYEDAQLLLVDKKPGLMVHGDGKGQTDTLINHVRAYLYQKGAFDSMDENAFAPQLCNRIDRFTGGMVVLAKDEQTLLAVNKVFKSRQVRKFYLCICHGSLRQPSGVFENYLSKPQGAKKVIVSDAPVPGGKAAKTAYETIACADGLSLVLCELFTGYTHQIRAQFAHAGHPLLGDNQYGSAKKNAPYALGYQALCAVGLKFALENPDALLAQYDKKAFCLNAVPFAGRYFEGIDWQRALGRVMEETDQAKED